MQQKYHSVSDCNYSTHANNSAFSSNVLMHLHVLVKALAMFSLLSIKIRLMISQFHKMV